jgi:hypothetical protein
MSQQHQVVQPDPGFSPSLVRSESRSWRMAASKTTGDIDPRARRGSMSKADPLGSRGAAPSGAGRCSGC